MIIPHDLRLPRLSIKVLHRLRRAASCAPGWVCGSELEMIGQNRVGARLDELRAAGAIIESKPGPGTWHLYRLTGWGAERAVRKRFDLAEADLRAIARGELPASVRAQAQSVLGLDRQPELFGA